jgi:hypothetical protein
MLLDDRFRIGGESAGLEAPRWPLPLHTLLPLGTGLIASTLLLASVPCGASAISNASINGAADSDIEFVTSTATASTAGPAAVGSATAYADLASGTLKARTEGAAADAFGGALDADASSELSDVLFLTPDMGSSTSPVLFTLFMDLDAALLVGGSGLAVPNLQQAAARAIASLQISGFAVSGMAPASVTVTRRVQASGGNVLDDSTTVDVQQNMTGSVVGADVDVRLTATAMVTPNSGFDIRAFVAAESGAEAAFSADSNLFQTAQLSVIVPDGYTMSSSSGIYLTVPEPGEVASFAAVGGALLWLVRRRTHNWVQAGGERCGS